VIFKRVFLDVDPAVGKPQNSAFAAPGWIYLYFAFAINNQSFFSQTQWPSTQSHIWGGLAQLQKSDKTEALAKVLKPTPKSCSNGPKVFGPFLDRRRNLRIVDDDFHTRCLSHKRPKIDKFTKM